MDTALFRAFLPDETYPGKVFQHGISKLRLTPILIQIFVTQDKNSLLLLCSTLSDKEGVGMTKMKKPGWGRCYSTPVMIFEYRF